MEKHTKEITVEYQADQEIMNDDTITDIINGLNRVADLVQGNKLKGNTIMLISLALVKKKDDANECIEMIKTILEDHVSKCRTNSEIEEVFKLKLNNNEQMDKSNE